MSNELKDIVNFIIKFLVV